MKNNKVFGLIAILVIIVASLVVGGVYYFNKNSKIFSKKIENSIPSGWKVFKGYGVSISAPSNFTISPDIESNGEISFGVNSPSSDSILVSKFSGKPSYDKFVSTMDNLKPYVNTNLVDDNYSFSEINSKLYTITSTESGLVSNMILIPDKLSYILITPSIKSWKGYSESDVNEMIQSINLETEEAGHVSISYQRAFANLLKTKEKLSNLVNLGNIDISEYSNEGHNPETDKIEPIKFSVDGITFSFDNCRKDQAQDKILKSYFVGNKKVIIDLPNGLSKSNYVSESYDNSNQFFFDSKDTIVVKDANGAVLKEFSNLTSRCSPNYYQVWLPENY